MGLAVYPRGVYRTRTRRHAALAGASRVLPSKTTRTRSARRPAKRRGTRKVTRDANEQSRRSRARRTEIVFRPA